MMVLLFARGTENSIDISRGRMSQKMTQKICFQLMKIEADIACSVCTSDHTI